jgi:Xaa-Pro aminopeptidase
LVPSATAFPYGERIERARLLMARERLDKLFVADPHCVRYLCGFTGSNGVLLLGEGSNLFLTDSRYVLQAGQETRGVEVREAVDLDRAAAEACAGQGARWVGYQASSLSAARAARFCRRLEGADLVDLGAALDALRMTKDAGELVRLREAARLAEDALGAVLEGVRPGNTEERVAREFQIECLRRGADGLAFEVIVASGERGALPHARPSGRPFRRGDLVVVDFGVRLDGYCSDETVTVPVGEVSDRARQVYEVVRAAQASALATLRPGVRLADVDRAAREVIREAGFGDRFGHGTGHGVGLAVHEAPTVSSRSDEVAREGMVVTVEPGIYLPDELGVRLEDTVFITADGCDSITALPKGFGAIGPKGA